MRLEWKYDKFNLFKFSFIIEISVEEERRIQFLNELISANNNKILIDGIDQAELDDSINLHDLIMVWF